MRTGAIWCVFAMMLACPGRSIPQRIQEGDTTRVYRMGEVVIPADRYPFSAEAAGAVVYSADSAYIASKPGGDVGDVIGTMRGVHLFRYGGGASLQTLSIRGLGSENTALLVNGMPAGNPQAGVSDLGLLPLAGFARIEVLPGGATAIFGSGAVGGAVNLVPRMPRSGDAAIEIGGGVASFGEGSRYARVAVQADSGVGAAVTGLSVAGRGDYSLPQDGRPALKLPNNDHRYKSLTLAMVLPARSPVHAEMYLNLMRADQGVPGPTTGTGTYSGARREDRRSFAGLWVSSSTEERISWSTAAVYDDQYERYFDYAGDPPSDDYYRVRSLGVSARIRYRLPANALLLAGSDLSGSVLDGNTGSAGKNKGAGSAFISIPIWWVSTDAQSIQAGVTPSLRYETTGGGGEFISWRTGVTASFGNEGMSTVPTVRFHASGGNGRRVPGFNDLYYASGGGRGNASLRAEFSHGFDAGVGGTWGILGGASWDVTYYRTVLTDRIVWLPADNIRVWAPQNIGSSISEGWEIGLRLEPVRGMVSIEGSYSTLNSRYNPLSGGIIKTYDKQLMYIPLDKGDVGIQWSGKMPVTWVKDITIGADLMYAGPRYTTEDNSAYLPSILLLNSHARLEFSVGGTSGTILYGIRNLTNQSYEIVPSYPLPGINQSVDLIIKLGS